MKVPNVSDGKNNAPQLIIYATAWGMSELPQRPSDTTWSFEEVLNRLGDAGYGGMQAGTKEACLVHKLKLRFAAAERANSPHDIERLTHEAADVGADSLTLHAGWGMESDDEMDQYALATLEAALEHRFPVYLETHRATLLQDIYRTCRLLERYPDLRLNADLSHYYCGHELTYRGFATTRSYLEPILQRVAFFHGRIASGETMQIDVGDAKSNVHIQNFAWLWQRAMTFWLKQAKPGDILPFAPELGPPSSGYSLTDPRCENPVVELSDRWAQSLVLADMARHAFAAAQHDASVSVPAG